MPKTIVKEVEIYKCSTCGKEYTELCEAVECEESHKCPCEKQDFYRLGYYLYYNDVFISGIYFKEKRIALMRDDDGTIRERDSTDVKYCPFCGRKL